LREIDAQFWAQTYEKEFIEELIQRKRKEIWLLANRTSNRARHQIRKKSSDIESLVAAIKIIDTGGVVK